MCCWPCSINRVYSSGIIPTTIALRVGCREGGSLHASRNRLAHARNAGRNCDVLCSSHTVTLPLLPCPSCCEGISRANRIIATAATSVIDGNQVDRFSLCLIASGYEAPSVLKQARTD